MELVVLRQPVMLTLVILVVVIVVISWVQRVDYSNDTATALQKGPLAVYAERLQATGNLNFGYFAGGDPGPSPAEIKSTTS